MTKSVWKFPLDLTDHPTVEMPAGTHVLTVMVQNETVTLWALVDVDAPLEEHQFHIFGAGWVVEDDLRYIGSVQLSVFVWHIFEEASS